MEMILVDWTRMGKVYCLAGAVADGSGWRFVRPLLVRYRDSPVRNVGWSAYLLDGHCRWEVFELVGVQVPPAEPPHVEDVWVRGLRPRQRSATPGARPGPSTARRSTTTSTPRPREPTGPWSGWTSATRPTAPRWTPTGNP